MHFLGGFDIGTSHPHIDACGCVLITGRMTVSPRVRVDYLLALKDMPPSVSNDQSDCCRPDTPQTHNTKAFVGTQPFDPASGGLGVPRGSPKF